jgi:hypothetical protein
MPIIAGKRRRGMSKMSGKVLGLLASAATLAFSATTAGAAVTTTITDITGTWTSTVPGVSGQGTNQISWGTPFPPNTEQSSYVFNAAGTPISFNVNDVFTLGEFVHNNFPITGTTLNSATLQVDIVGSATNGATVPINISTDFSFSHNETINFPNDNSCDATGGGAPPANGCPDVVTATSNPSDSQTFTIDGAEYALDVTGFQVGGTTFSDFATDEDTNNPAQLRAQFQQISEPPEPMPVPATLGLLGAGLVGLGVLTARRKRA